MDLAAGPCYNDATSFVEAGDDVVELVAVDSGNIGLYDFFDDNFDQYLKGYLSRIRPRRHTEYEELTRNKMLFWRYIMSDGACLGSVWLEKDNQDDRTATLGIFIIDEAYQGKGFGEYIVREVIRTGRDFLGIDKVQLSVRESNVRAHRCYIKCGFTEIFRFTSRDGFKAIHMELELGS